jgi:CubicO group peptidase (beta-lactamase class C family)
MSDIQEQVQETLDELVASGAELGIQAVAYRDGVKVVDAVAGVVAPDGPPVTPGTVFYNFYIGMGAMSTLVHQEVDRGAFGYDTPVVELWPEFGAHGKEGVTVGHVLTHTAGVPGIPLSSTLSDLCTWETMTRALEDAELWWEPGTKTGYHAYTFGYLSGEIVRRSTGLPLADVLRNRLAAPLEFADEIFFGMPEDKRGSLATLVGAPSEVDWSSMQLPDDLPMFRAAPMSLFPTADFGNNPEAIGADIPAGGKTSARAIAKMYAALIGEVDGVRLVSPERLAAASKMAVEGQDEVFGNEVRWSLGYAMGAPFVEEHSETTFGMGGAGGSWAGADTATGTSLAVTKNLLTENFDTSTQIARMVFA